MFWGKSAHNWTSRGVLSVDYVLTVLFYGTPGQFTRTQGTVLLRPMLSTSSVFVDTAFGLWFVWNIHTNMCTLYGRGFIYTSIYVCTWGRVAALRSDSALESRKVGIVFFWSLAEAFRPYDCTYSSAWYRYMLLILPCIVYVYIHTSKYYSWEGKGYVKIKLVVAT